MSLSDFHQEGIGARAGAPITGPNLFDLNFSVSALESNSLAGYFRHNRSNLCTRHIPHKLTPRGHHEWPVMPNHPDTGSHRCRIRPVCNQPSVSLEIMPY